MLRKFGDCCGQKEKKRCVRKPAETEALPLHVNKRDCTKAVVLFNSEHLDEVCADATLKNMFAGSPGSG